MKFTAFLLSLLLADLSFSQEVSDINPSERSGLRLKLATEKYFTDTNGVFQVSQLISAPVGNLVRIYKTDGEYYTAQITEIEESSEFFKIYGNVLNKDNARFGFALAKGGVFAGAIVEKGADRVYTVEFSVAHKGFILQRARGFETL
jgi:hypothetical protein